MAAAKGNSYTLKRKKHPQYTEKQIQGIADDLIKFVIEDRSIHLAPFCIKYKKSKPWLHELASRHPVIKQALEQAIGLLSAKVLNSSFYGDGNATVGMAYLPIYDSDFKELLRFKAELAKQQPQQDQAKGAFNSYVETQKGDDRS